MRAGDVEALGADGGGDDGEAGAPQHVDRRDCFDVLKAGSKENGDFHGDLEGVG